MGFVFSLVKKHYVKQFTLVREFYSSSISCLSNMLPSDNFVAYVCCKAVTVPKFLGSGRKIFSSISSFYPEFFIQTLKVYFKFTERKSGGAYAIPHAAASVSGPG